jgi:hypothetical protein
MARLLIFTRHAEDMLRERGLDPDWIAITIANPETLEPDPDQPSLLRAFRRIPERGGRYLRVVYEVTESETRVITAFFDRNHPQRS